MSNSTKLYSIKTIEAYTIKTIIEVLQNLLTDVCFEFTKDGVKLFTVDNLKPEQLLVNLVLHKDKFEEFYCKKVINAGINLQHFYKMLKSIKKKDQIEIFINTEDPGLLKVCTKQSDSSVPTYSDIKIQKLSKIDPGVVTGYDRPILISTTNFQKMCKDMNSIAKEITVFSKGSFIEFRCKVEKMYNRSVPFGTLDENSNDPEFEEKFYTKTLNNLIKISGLNSKMQIFIKKDLPLKFCIETGSLGVLEIYLHSIRHIESEKQQYIARNLHCT